MGFYLNLCLEHNITHYDFSGRCLLSEQQTATRNAAQYRGIDLASIFLLPFFPSLLLWLLLLSLTSAPYTPNTQMN